MIAGSSIVAGRVFIDTNVLIHAYDRSESDKQRQARLVLDDLVANDAGVISTQVLGKSSTVSRGSYARRSLSRTPQASSPSSCSPSRSST